MLRERVDGNEEPVRSDISIVEALITEVERTHSLSLDLQQVLIKSTRNTIPELVRKKKGNIKLH